MELHGPPYDALRHVLRFLDSYDGAMASCVARDWRDAVARDDTLWRGWLERDFCLSCCASPSEEPTDSWRTAYRLWRREAALYGDAFVRARKAWRVVEDWTAEHAPAIRGTLRPPASEAQVQAAAAALAGADIAALPRPLAALYRCHDGQETEADVLFDSADRSGLEHPSIFDGLFGGYAFYDHVVCMRMLPLQRMLRWSQYLHQQLPALAGCVVFAASFNMHRLLVVDTASGQVQAMCSPRDRIDAVAPLHGRIDGALRWFEAFADRLNTGAFVMQPLVPEAPATRALCIYPQAGPGTYEETTAGVHVRVSPLFIPEMSRPRSRQYHFAYCVRFSMPTDDDGAGNGGDAPAACQLVSRHWVIKDGTGSVVDEVSGEGVIGQFPELAPGCEEFVYCSCTQQRDFTGSMGGHFEFLPGRIDNPNGPKFIVKCPEFKLEKPEYIF